VSLILRRVSDGAVYLFGSTALGNFWQIVFAIAAVANGDGL
jgi:hypothetical protein